MLQRVGIGGGGLVVERQQAGRDGHVDFPTLLALTHAIFWAGTVAGVARTTEPIANAWDAAKMWWRFASAVRSSACQRPVRGGRIMNRTVSERRGEPRAEWGVVTSVGDRTDAGMMADQVTRGRVIVQQDVLSDAFDTFAG
ncbi:MAG: hypothetical protein ACRYG8_50825 [Janthinobacterium lividum]